MAGLGVLVGVGFVSAGLTSSIGATGSSTAGAGAGEVLEPTHR